MQVHYHTVEETSHSSPLPENLSSFWEVSLHVIQNLITWATVSYMTGLSGQPLRLLRSGALQGLLGIAWKAWKHAI